MAQSVWRRIERFSLGIVFGIAAWIIERRVLKSIRKRGQSPPKPTLAEHATSEVEKPRS